MAQKLAEIIALEKGKKTRADDTLTKAYQILQKPDLFRGVSKTYDPLEEGGEQYPSEVTMTQVHLEEIIEATMKPFQELLDISLVRDTTNCQASADIVVNGTVIAIAVPVTFLLMLEKKLVDLVTFIGKIPVLDPSDHWDWDETRRCYVTPVVLTRSTKKVPRPFVKYDATKEHPAQVEVVHEDIRVGTWNTTKFSTAWPRAEVDAAMEKARALQDAVKVAREQANQTTAVNAKIGEALVKFIFS